MKVLLGLMVLILILLAEIFVGVKLWNWLCPELLDVKEITPLQFVALWGIVNILTSHPFRVDKRIPVIETVEED